MKKLFVLALTFSLAAVAQAQTADTTAFPVATAAAMPEKFVLAGASANAFKGELNEYYNRYMPGVHLTLQFNRKKRLNGSFNFQAGSLQMQALRSQIKEGQAANAATFVKTSFLALHYDLHLNLVKTNHWIAYIGQGAGLMRFEPKDRKGDKLAGNASTRAKDEEYSSISLLLPTSLGAQYIFDNGFGLGLQAGLLNPLTKYLDNLEDAAVKSRADNVLQWRFSLVVPLNLTNKPADIAPAPVGE